MALIKIDVAKWLGLADDDVADGRRGNKKKNKPQFDRGARAHYQNQREKRRGRGAANDDKPVSKARRGRVRRDPDLPGICTDDFSGNVRIKGKSVRFIDGVKQKGK